MDATQKKGSSKQLRGRSLGTKLSELVHETRPGDYQSVELGRAGFQRIVM